MSIKILTFKVLGVRKRDNLTSLKREAQIRGTMSIRMVTLMCNATPERPTGASVVGGV